MKILIDTQSFIWFIEDDSRLPSFMRSLMENSDTLVVSIASFWEMTIKASLGKLTFSGNITEIIDRALANGFNILPIEREHLYVLFSLDFFHRDPFDRIIISQAISENIPVISSDSIFQQYPINCIWK
jgi:PIN domain nuclease of toxin-antitoxin system